MDKELESLLKFNIIYLSDIKDAILILQNRFKDVKYRLAIVGYSDSSKNYQAIVTDLIYEFIKDLIPDLAIITSPTTDKGSIDVVNTFISQRFSIPILYFTAIDYVSSINPKILSGKIDKNKYINLPKYVFSTIKDYSEATAKVSNLLLLLGGRSFAVTDFVNAINNNNKVFIINHTAFGSVDFNEKCNMPMNASLYITEQINSFLKNKKLIYPSCNNFTYKFLENNCSKLKNLVEIRYK